MTDDLRVHANFYDHLKRMYKGIPDREMEELDDNTPDSRDAEGKTWRDREKLL